MNNKGFLRIGVLVSITALLGGVCAGAWAQGGASSSESSGATAASAASTPREIRKANRALSRKVYAALAKHKEIDAGAIGIAAKSGAVLISGTVPDASQINTVIEIVKGVAGVTSVTSKLSVQRPFGQ